MKRMPMKTPNKKNKHNGPSSPQVPLKKHKENWREMEASATTLYEKATSSRLFVKGENALVCLRQVTPETFCDDHISMAVNTLERIYKGFLQAETLLPGSYIAKDSKINNGHNVYALHLEISNHFNIKGFNSLSKEELKRIKNYAVDYTRARYWDDYSYKDLKIIVNLIENKRNVLLNYVKNQCMVFEKTTSKAEINKILRHIDVEEKDFYGR